MAAGPVPWWVSLLVVAGVLSAVLAVVTARNRTAPGARWLVVLNAGAALVAVLTIVEVAVVTPDLFALLASQRVAVEIVLVAAWLSFVLEYAGVTVRRGLQVVFWTVTVAFAVLTATQELHGLLWARTSIRGDVYEYLEPEGALLFQLVMVLLIAYAAVGFWHLWRTARSDEQFAGQAVALMVGSLPPFVAGVLEGFDVPIASIPGFPLMQPSFTVLGVALTYAILREELLDLVPATRRIGVSEAFDDLSEGVLVVGPAGTVLHANDSACRLFDRDRGAVVGEPVEAVVGAEAVPVAGSRPASDPGGADGAVEAGDAVAADGDGTGTVGPFPRTFERDGRVVETTSSTIERGGGVIGRTYLFHDVTERRRHEQRLSVLARVLRHNLRNDVTVIVNALEHFEETATDEDERELAATALAQGYSLIDVSEDARALEQAMAAAEGGPRPVDLVPAVTRTVERLREEFPDAEFEVTLPDSATVSAVPPVEEAIYQACENAAEHNDAGEPWVGVTVERRGEETVVVVADDGPGIPEHEGAAVGAEEETALEHGSGLGLWLVHLVCQRSGGAVRAADREPRGTRVTMAFDAADGER